MSSYVESVINSGETVEYSAKVSVWSLLPLLIFGVLLLPIFGIGLVLWIIAYLRYISTELAITNKKVIAKVGFIKRDTIELLLPKVESVQVHQSVLGRMLDYGSVVVVGAGASQAPVMGISNPIAFRKRFMDIQDKLS